MLKRAFVDSRTVLLHAIHMLASTHDGVLATMQTQAQWNRSHHCKNPYQHPSNHSGKGPMLKTWPPLWLGIFCRVGTQLEQNLKWILVSKEETMHTPWHQRSWTPCVRWMVANNPTSLFLAYNNSLQQYPVFHGLFSWAAWSIMCYRRRNKLRASMYENKTSLSTW